MAPGLSPFLQKSQTIHTLTNYLSSKPFKAVVADANDVTQHTPTWVVHDREGRVLFRYVGHWLDGQMRGSSLVSGPATSPHSRCLV